MSEGMGMGGALVVAGENRLALGVGAGVPGRALARISALRNSAGWLVRGNLVSEWRFEGFAEERGVSHLYGPFFPCAGLEETLSLNLDAALPRIALVADALALLAERSMPLFPLQTDGVCLTEDGGVLFLPPEVLREVRGLRTFAANRDVFESVNHPDLKGEEAVSFALAAILYRLSTGRFPFSGDNAEDVHEQARSLDILPPDRASPGVSRGFSDAVMAGLGRGGGVRPTLGRWRELLASWAVTSPLVQLGAKERERISMEAAGHGEEAARRFRRRRFWRRNGKIVAVVAAGVAVVGILLGTVLKGVLAPRITHGYTAEKVVRTFYSGMNTLDHASMQAAVTGSAGNAEISEVTNIYVISRVTLGYEGRSGVVSAAEWDRGGRPLLDPPLTVYGVTDLSLRQDQGEPSPVFTASYVKWTPVPQDREEQAAAGAPEQPRYQGTATTDRLLLRQDRGDWVIFRIDRLEQKTLPPPPAR